MLVRQQKIVVAVAVMMAVYLIYFLMYTTKTGHSLRYLRTLDRQEHTHTAPVTNRDGVRVMSQEAGNSTVVESGHPETQGHPQTHEPSATHRQPTTTVLDHKPAGNGSPIKDTKNWTCVDRWATQYGRVEDVFCTSLGKLEPKFKNPCFYDYLQDGHKRLRCLPYFYIIGPDKCGTTDLHSRLMHHPQLMDNKGVIGKEASFWGWRSVGMNNFRRWIKNDTTEFYMDVFDRTAQLLETGGNSSIVTGDASPMDFYDFHGWRRLPQNLGKDEPEVLVPHMIREFHKTHIPKMIAHFRDPIERIFSLYVFLGRGNNPERFHNDVLESMGLLEGCMATQSRRVCFFDGDLFKRMPVKLATSCYSVFLKEWLSPFPRSSFFITRLEDTSTNMKQALKDIYSFLELEPLPEDILDTISEKAKRHVTKAKVGVTMLPKTAEVLRQFYQPCNQELAKMLEDDRFLWNDTPHE